MPTITLDVSDELAAQFDRLGDRVPELLALSIQQPAVPASVYRSILDFLASDPSPEAIASFGPTDAMRERLQTLLDRSANGTLTAAENEELAEFERIEHLMILIKTRNLALLAPR
jgi:hypothetical protein